MMNIQNKASDPFSNQPFKDLKKLLKKKRKTVQSAVIKNEPPVINDEIIFQESMKEVVEIKQYRELPVYQNKSTYSCRTGPSDDDTLQALEEIIEGKRQIHLPDTSEYVEWIDQAYRDSIIRNLHEGKYSIQDCLDLHGVVADDARVEVGLFIRESVRKGHKCIKIIHGRGLRSPNGPVLKKALVKWLLSSYRKYVIAFVTARQCDGGLGALYILLK